MVEVLQHLASFPLLYFLFIFSPCIIHSVILEHFFFFSVKKNISLSLNTREFWPRCVHLSYLRLPIIIIPAADFWNPCTRNEKYETRIDHHSVPHMQYMHCIMHMHTHTESFGLFLYVSYYSAVFLLTFEYFMYCSSLLAFLIFIFLFSYFFFSYTFSLSSLIDFMFIFLALSLLVFSLFLCIACFRLWRRLQPTNRCQGNRKKNDKSTVVAAPADNESPTYIPVTTILHTHRLWK